jgi:hypothetical protein
MTLAFTGDALRNRIPEYTIERMINQFIREQVGLHLASPNKE